MYISAPEGKLREYLIAGGHTELLDGFQLTKDQQALLVKLRAESMNVLPEGSGEEREAWAIFSAATHPGQRIPAPPPDAEPPLPQATTEVQNAVGSIRGSAIKLAHASKGLEAAVSELPSSLGKTRRLVQEAHDVAEETSAAVRQTADVVRSATSEHVRAATLATEGVSQIIREIQAITQHTKDMVTEAQRVILSFPEGPITVIRTQTWSLWLGWAWRAAIFVLLVLLLALPARSQETGEITTDPGDNRTVTYGVATPWSPTPLSPKDIASIQELQLKAYTKLVEIKNKYAEAKDLLTKAKDAEIAALQAEIEALKMEFVELRDINLENARLQKQLRELYAAEGWMISEDFEWVEQKKKENRP